MTRHIRRAVLATTAALASIGLHGQPTTADNGLLDLDGLLAAVVDASDTEPDSEPDPGPTPVPTLLEQPIAVLQPVLTAVGGPIDLPPVIADLVDPLLPVPPPAVPLVPVPVPPAADPLGPEPSAGQGPAPTTVAVVPPVVPGSRPVITRPADDVDAVAIGDADRGWTSSHAPGPASVSLARGRGDSHVSETAPPGSRLTSPAGDAGAPRLDGTAVGPTRSGIDPEIERDAGPAQAPIDTTSTWDAAVGGGGGFPTGALAVGIAAVVAVAVAVAAFRRATNARRARVAEAFADARHARNRVSAGTSPPSREPPGRVSAETRPLRVPPSRASADARPNRREPRPGVGGRSVERVGRDRRVLRSPPARSPRTNARQPAGPRRQSRGNH